MSASPGKVLAKADCSIQSCVLIPDCRDNGHSDAPSEIKAQRRAMTKALNKFLETGASSGAGGQDPASMLALSVSMTSVNSNSTTAGGGGLPKDARVNELKFSHTTVVDVLPTLDPVQLKEYEAILAVQREVPLSGKRRVANDVKKATSLAPRPWGDRRAAGDSDEDENGGEEGRSSAPLAPLMDAPSTCWCPWLVTKLTITHNYQLSQLPVNSILQLVNLWELDLGYNAIKVFPKALCCKFTLEQEDQLWAARNTENFHHDQDDSQQGGMRNPYSSIEPSGNPFPDLAKLVLDNNALVFLPKQISCLRKMRVLSLENNQLLGLPNELRLMPLLGELRVGNNNFVDDQEGGDGLESEEGEGEEDDEERVEDPSERALEPPPMPSDEYLDLVLPYHCGRPTRLLEALTGHQVSVEQRVCTLLEEGVRDAEDTREQALVPMQDAAVVSAVNSSGMTNNASHIVATSPPRHRLPSSNFDLVTSRCSHKPPKAASSEFLWLHGNEHAKTKNPPKQKASGRKGAFTKDHRTLLLNTYFGAGGQDWGSFLRGDEGNQGGDDCSSEGPHADLLGPFMKQVSSLTGPTCSLCGAEFTASDFLVEPPVEEVDQTTTTRIVKKPKKPTPEQKESWHYQKPLALVSFVDLLGNKSVPIIFFACGWKPTPKASPPASPTTNEDRGGSPVLPDDAANGCAAIIVRDVMESTPVSYSRLNYDVYCKTPTRGD